MSEVMGPPVRRFARGESASPEALKDFLDERGYEVWTPAVWTRPYVLRKRGLRGRRALWRRELIAFVDELRLAEGLQPFLPPRAG